jgi:uncharacterized membrane protein (UPF0127 family)
MISKMLIFFSILPFVFTSCQKQPEDIKIDTSDQKETKLTAFKKQGEVYFQDSLKTLIKKIDVEIADNDDARHLGLMYREGMKEDEGMLFIFPKEEEQSFYMKNTVLPLDIIFVNAKKQIVKIHKNTTPFSESSLPSDKPSLYVIEVNSGFTDKFKIKEGSMIDWRRN